MYINRITGTSEYNTWSKKKKTTHPPSVIKEDKIDITFTSHRPSSDNVTHKEVTEKIEKEAVNLKNRESIPSVPLYITLDIDGKEIEKTVRGSISDDEITLKIKHTGDVHGNMSHVASLIHPDEFWIDSGDTWQGYNFHSVVSRGFKELEMMNRRDCDLAVPGNHMFDADGVNGGEEIIGRAKFPYLSSNTELEGTAPCSIAEVGGVKIAFIGVLTPDKTASMADPYKIEDLKIKNPLEAVRKSVEKVKAEGADNIIVISHLGLERNGHHNPLHITDKELAENVPGIDLIMGGHTHTPTHEKIEVKGTRIVHAGVDTHLTVDSGNLYIGDLSLKIDRVTKKIKSIEHKLLKVDRLLPVHKDIQEIEDKYLLKEKTILDEKLGENIQALNFNVKSPTDTSLGNMITDAIREETGADISFLSTKFFTPMFEIPGIPVNISLPQREVKMADLVNSGVGMGRIQDVCIETWPVSGKTIKFLMERGIRRLLDSKASMGLYQVSGITMTYDPKKPPNNRITEILIGDKPLNEYKIYRVTSSSFDSDRDYLFSDRNRSEVISGRNIRDIVADYIKQGKCKETITADRIKSQYS